MKKIVRHGNASEEVAKALEHELSKLKANGVEITPEAVKRAYNRIYCRRYRARNKEAVKEYQREYRAKNKEALSEYNKTYREKNRKALNEYKREYNRKNRDKMKANREKAFKNIADNFNSKEDI